MRTLSFGRYWLSIAAGALLFGCAGMQPPVAPPPGTAESGVGDVQGWMLPEAQSQTLLYVSASPNEVFVYSYPRPRLVGQLHFKEDVEGLCSDSEGNVWVPLFDPATSSGKLVEYKHGSKRRIAALSDNGFPSGCAIEPATGDLAVTNSCIDYRGSTCLDYGDVVIYTAAHGAGTLYEDPTMNDYGFCAYDNSGDLFVEGTDDSGSFTLAELRKGQSTLQNVALSQSLTTPAGIQWHGRHLVIASASTLYEFSVSHARATEVGSSPLKDTSEAVQFALQGNVAVVPGVQSYNIAYYRYPGGGTPSITILFFRAISATLSVRPATL